MIDQLKMIREEGYDFALRTFTGDDYLMIVWKKGQVKETAKQEVGPNMEDIVNRIYHRVRTKLTREESILMSKIDAMFKDE